LSKIISIGTAVPPYRHQQEDILKFMQLVYMQSADEQRKLRYLYRQSGIDIRYSVVADYSRDMHDWKFYPATEGMDPFPGLEQRMQWYRRYAPLLSVDAIRRCLDHRFREDEITHLITVSCTGMSAPGLDLQVMEHLDLPRDIFRTSVNFMGCYAAIHAMRMGDMICKTDPAAKVLIVCTELCTLHFQREATPDQLASAMLFADGAAAVLMTPDAFPGKGLRIDGFHAEVVPKGKADMSWELSSTGFLMTLSGYVPDLIEADIEPLVRQGNGQSTMATK
jgi:predicted naringenin-chalcone synthase